MFDIHLLPREVPPQSFNEVASLTTAGDAREADRLPDRFLPCSDDRNRDSTAISADATPFTLDQDVQRLQQQVASAQTAKELAQLDLEWERERRKYLLVTESKPAGEIPNRSDAIGALVIGGIFALALILGTVLLNAFLLLLVSPILAALGYIIAAAIQQYRLASGYQRALAGYLAQRSHIELSSGTATRTGHSSTQPLASEATVAELMDQIVEQRYQAALASLDREWEIEREKHYVLRRSGRRYIPTRQEAVSMAVGWMVVGAIMVVTGTPTNFPYSGVVFALLGIGGGFYLYYLARKYALALSTYQTRRKQLCREQFVDITPGIPRHGGVTVGRAEEDAERGAAADGGDM
ncbi:MAG TPA: hypothetical protein VH643_35175 [Gemmataceae bacterium]